MPKDCSIHALHPHLHFTNLTRSIPTCPLVPEQSSLEIGLISSDRQTARSISDAQADSGGLCEESRIGIRIEVQDPHSCSPISSKQLRVCDIRKDCQGSGRVVVVLVAMFSSTFCWLGHESGFLAIARSGLMQQCGRDEGRSNKFDDGRCSGPTPRDVPRPDRLALWLQLAYTTCQ